MSKKLIAFYSRADENYVSGTLKMLSTGNTEIAAHIMEELTGGDLFHIDRQNHIPKDITTALLKQKRSSSKMPDLS